MGKHEKSFIIWFEEIGIEDVPLVGGKNASLGEMYQHLNSQGVLIPNGFAITAHAYRHLLASSGIIDSMNSVLEGLDTGDMQNLSIRGEAVRQIIREAPFPQDLLDEITSAYQKLEVEYGGSVDVAVRSSATAEDLPVASFAGQQDTYLNIRGVDSLIQACRKCFASLFTNRAISYRKDKGFGQMDVYLAIAVQKMVRSDHACSGVIFSIDTESGFEDSVLITGSWGLGENVVQGAVNPDEFYVFKPTLRQGKRPIVGKRVGSKEMKMIYDDSEGAADPVKNIATSIEERVSYILSNDEILHLASWACIIEDHYKKPMDIEWAKDGDGKTGTGKLFIVQARPETVHSQANRDVVQTYKVTVPENSHILCSGLAVGAKIGQGEVNVIQDAEHIQSFKAGQVLVTDMTDPDWEPIMKIAGAIVTNRGGRCCHASIISRELGIPCVVGTANGTELIPPGVEVTVSAAEGETGNVYEGLIPFHVEELNLSDLPKTSTKVKIGRAHV